jgi:hypothetical protein
MAAQNINTQNANAMGAKATRSDTLSDSALGLVVGGGGSGKATHPAPPARARWSGGASFGWDPF